MDWGLLVLNSGDEAVSPVVDMYSGTHYVQITLDKYETGCGNRETYIRYSNTLFAYGDLTPTWELYTVGRNITARYIQIKLKGL
jgi:hypothetical protein